MFIKNLNLFINEFLINNKKNEKIEEVWNSKKHQQLLLKMLKQNNITIKDPDKPKRGKSAFLFYCEENRKKLKEKYDGYSVKQIVQKLGLDWKKLKETNPDEIDKYEKMSIVDRERYKTEMKNYIPILSRKIEIKNEIKKTSKRRSKNELLFDNFVKTKKKRLKKTRPELDSVDMIEYLQNKWINMSDEKKLKYNSKKDKEKINEELKK